MDMKGLNKWIPPKVLQFLHIGVTMITIVGKIVNMNWDIGVSGTVFEPRYRNTSSFRPFYRHTYLTKEHWVVKTKKVGLIEYKYIFFGLTYLLRAQETNITCIIILLSTNVGVTSLEQSVEHRLTRHMTF